MDAIIEIPDEIYRFIRDNPSINRAALSKRFGISENKAKFYKFALESQRATPKDISDLDQLKGINVDEKFDINEGGLVNVYGKCLSSEYDKEGVIKRAIDEAGIDYKSWTIDRIETSRWQTSMKIRKRTGQDQNAYVDTVEQVTNWKVGIKLKSNGSKHYIEAAEKIITSLKPVKPYKLVKLNNGSDLCGVIEPADAHIGKYAWHEETLGGNMDVPIAVKKFQNSTGECLKKMARDGLSKIFIVVGHDITHIDNQKGETPHGKNQLDYDTRLPHIIAETEKVLIGLCDDALQIAPLEIIWVPGNHDYHSSYMLCRILAQRYANNKHVNVDIGASQRKMILWGDNLIGLVHDAEGRKRNATVNLLAQYEPWKKHWSASKWVELHTGHLHRREVETIGGVIWRRIPAMSTIDSWHCEGVFTDAVPCCDSFVYHKKNGIYAEYPTNISYT